MASLDPQVFVVRHPVLETMSKHTVIVGSDSKALAKLIKLMMEDDDHRYKSVVLYHMRDDDVEPFDAELPNFRHAPIEGMCMAKGTRGNAPSDQALHVYDTRSMIQVDAIITRRIRYIHENHTVLIVDDHTRVPSGYKAIMTSVMLPNNMVFVDQSTLLFDDFVSYHHVQFAFQHAEQAFDYIQVPLPRRQHLVQKPRYYRFEQPVDTASTSDGTSLANNNTTLPSSIVRGTSKSKHWLIVQSKPKIVATLIKTLVSDASDKRIQWFHHSDHDLSPYFAKLPLIMPKCLTGLSFTNYGRMDEMHHRDLLVFDCAKMDVVQKIIEHHRNAGFDKDTIVIVDRETQVSDFYKQMMTQILLPSDYRFKPNCKLILDSEAEKKVIQQRIDQNQFTWANIFAWAYLSWSYPIQMPHHLESPHHDPSIDATEPIHHAPCETINPQAWSDTSVQWKRIEHTNISENDGTTWMDMPTWIRFLMDKLTTRNALDRSRLQTFAWLSITYPYLKISYQCHSLKMRHDTLHHNVLLIHDDMSRSTTMITAAGDDEHSVLSRSIETMSDLIVSRVVPESTEADSILSWMLPNTNP